MTWELDHVYAGLKDFQLASVEHAAEQLFGESGSGRFLVADEVGLGKTMIAKGLIAKALEHHQAKGTERIDIVYVCSNGDIARQNVNRLNVLEGKDFSHATRLTMLPRLLTNLRQRDVNFVSFTPGTSFNLRSSEGVQAERAILFHMVRRLWDGQVRFGNPGVKVFAGWADFKGFARHVDVPDNDAADDELLRAFARELESLPGGVAELQDHYRELRERFSGIHSQQSSRITPELRQQRADLVGTLRQRLAHACVEALRPDLVILDEFQRFKQLFDPDDPAGALAQTLFDYPDVAVLLLSATPYKMYTDGDDDENHYRDFLDTVRFLRRDDAAVDRLADDIGSFRRSLLSSDHSSRDRAMQAKGRVETTLREVMSRNERLAATQDRSGMLTERAAPNLELTTGDVHAYRTLRHVGRRIEVAGAPAYWEATPYPLSHLDGYVFGKRFKTRVERDPSIVDGLDLEPLSLNFDDVHAYRRTDPGNARMRSLEADTVERGLWRLVWLPPSLPYHRLDGPYADTDLQTATKRLVFSAWAVVPRAIATHLSFEAERRMMTAAGPATNTAEARDKFSPLLTFTRSNQRLTGMRLWGLLYPSPTLARLGDPLAIARTAGPQTEPLSLPTVLDAIRAAVQEPVTSLAWREDRSVQDGSDWYWAVPLLLDHQADPEGTRAWLEDQRLAATVLDGIGAKDDGGTSGLREHLDRAVALLDGRVGLGAQPGDLVDVVAELALAGPGTCAARALTRGRCDATIDDPEVRRAAVAVAGGFRTLFNTREVTTMLRAESRGHAREDAYWRLVLRYSVDGGLQAVLDEWVHVLFESTGLIARPFGEALTGLAIAMREAMSVTTVNYAARRLEHGVDGIRVHTERLRGHFALRFGDEKAETDTSVQRAANVRVAFNSPFRPFVLATTSVGQEGLDFHTYCHAVVHWNLPRNPVDLEQREGRVHRYKNHAVRRNVAQHHRTAALLADGDPWAAMFDHAAEERPEDGDELTPFWVYRGAAAIERYVPALPLSREAHRFEELKRTTAAYRLVFGQPRQEDLLAYLDGHSEEGDDLSMFRINLRPPAIPASSQVAAPSAEQMPRTGDHA